jgi:hypothetical protein
VKIDRSDLGPVEILTVGFTGDRFSGEIQAALQELIAAGTIRVLDLAFVRKAPDGTVTMFKGGDLQGGDSETYQVLVEVDDGLVTDADLADAGESLEPGSAAAVLVWEDRWAKRFVDAIRGANGELISIQRVPAYAVDELLDSLEAG